MTSHTDPLPKLPTMPKGAGRPGKLPKLAKVPAKRSDPTPDPLAEVEYTGNLEEDSARELTALEEGYRERMRNEQARFVAATDSEYWLCLCFADRAERERFLAAVGENPKTKYLLGRDLARTLDIDY